MVLFLLVLWFWAPLLVLLPWPWLRRGTLLVFALPAFEEADEGRAVPAAATEGGSVLPPHIFTIDQHIRCDPLCCCTW